MPSHPIRQVEWDRLYKIHNTGLSPLVLQHVQLKLSQESNRSSVQFGAAGIIAAGILLLVDRLLSPAISVVLHSLEADKPVSSAVLVVAALGIVSGLLACIFLIDALSRAAIRSVNANAYAPPLNDVFDLLIEAQVAFKERVLAVTKGVPEEQWSEQVRQTVDGEKLAFRRECDCKVLQLWGLIADRTQLHNQSRHKSLNRALLCVVVSAVLLATVGAITAYAPTEKQTTQVKSPVPPESNSPSPR